MKTPVDWIIFDADETLFRFDDFTGLKQAFAAYGVDFGEAEYRAYQAVNQPLWVDYQQHKITVQDLHEKRFEYWSNHLKVPARELNSAFLKAMSEVCSPMEGATELIHALNGHVKMGIITNGYTELQNARLESLGFKPYFEFLVASEMIGVAKPHPLIFDHARQLMGSPPPEKILMVGDNLDSDIIGAIRAGWQSCWFNRHGKPCPETIRPDYEIQSFSNFVLSVLTPTLSS